jgi:hypothetical protein
MNQPMGASGIDLDIVTGQPRQIKTREEHQAQEELKEVQALQRATKLSQELPEVVTVMARLLEQKATELMKGNEFCQGIIQQAKAYNITLDLPRLVASKIRRQSFGVILNAMTDETQVAREDTD